MVQPRPNPYIESDENVISVSGSTGGSRFAWARLTNAIGDAVNRGFREIDLICDLQPPHEPLFDVAVAAALHGFKNAGVNIRVTVPSDRLESQLYSFLYPLAAATSIPPPRNEFFSRVWRFSSETASDLASAFEKNATEMVPWAAGAWEFFVLVLYELIDNVVEHASSDYGFIEEQVHSSGTVLLAVADPGIGIRTSFLRSREYAPRSDQDAIMLSIKQGVTSLDARGRGNGLWFATRNAAAGNGAFTLISGEGRMFWPPNAIDPQISPVSRFKDRKTGITHPSAMTIGVVDFNAMRSIDSIEVLGYKPSVAAWEAYADDQKISISIAEQSRGFATRRAAEQLRNTIERCITRAALPLSWTSTAST